MGQAVTKLYSLLSREVKMYNIERRATKVISQEKPTPAPMYPSTIEELQRLDKENISKEYLQTKNKKLDDYLKKVYVTAEEPAPPIKRTTNPERPLPLNRHFEKGLPYGYSIEEEENVPEGRVSLKQALQFIADHQSNPDVHDSNTIAVQYKLNTTTTANILQYFKMFNVHMNEKEEDPEKLSSYDKLQLKVKHLSMSNISEVAKEFKKTYKKNASNSGEGKELSGDVKNNSDYKSDKSDEEDKRTR